MSTLTGNFNWLVKIRTMLSTVRVNPASNPLVDPMSLAVLNPQPPSQRQTEIRYRCPCCGSRTLSAPAAMGLCPVCWWEDDGQEDGDASEVRLTVNGDLSLVAAREHYRQCGASHPRFTHYVRMAFDTEQ